MSKTNEQSTMTQLMSIAPESIEIEPGNLGRYTEIDIPVADIVESIAQNLKRGARGVTQAIQVVDLTRGRYLLPAEFSGHRRLEAALAYNAEQALKSRPRPVEIPVEVLERNAELSEVDKILQAASTNSTSRFTQMDQISTWVGLTLANRAAEETGGRKASLREIAVATGTFNADKDKISSQLNLIKIVGTAVIEGVLCPEVVQALGEGNLSFDAVCKSITGYSMSKIEDGSIEIPAVEQKDLVANAQEIRVAKLGVAGKAQWNAHDWYEAIAQYYVEEVEEESEVESTETSDEETSEEGTESSQPLVSLRSSRELLLLVDPVSWKKSKVLDVRVAQAFHDFLTRQTDAHDFAKELARMLLQQTKTLGKFEDHALTACLGDEIKRAQKPTDGEIVDEKPFD